MNTKNSDVFETAVAAVRDESIDAQTVAAAQERVRARLASGFAAAEAGGQTVAPELTADSHRIGGCDGFRALLPAYLAGALAEPKRVLVEDHTRECVGCRRAVTALRRGEAKLPVASPTHRARRFAGLSPRAALAAGLAGVALLSGAILFRAGVFTPSPTAAVQSIDGELAIVESAGIRPAVAGERFGGATAVRTGGESGAVVTLADGSKVELAERSELSLDKRWDGTVLKLARGSVIVEAAKQRRGHLYVETGDCQVAVVGTIFSVNAGAKGSRVSVIEGEVRVQQGVERAVLRPGDQIATGRVLGAVPVAQEIAWSRNAADYRERLAALQSLGRELDRTLVSAGARSSTRLLDLSPEGTGVYVAVPNLSQSLAEAWSLVERRASENPALSEWWNERFPENARDEVDAAVAELARFGGELGPEIAIAVDLSDTSTERDDSRAVILAEVLRPQSFSTLLDEEIARINAAGRGHENAPRLRRVANPNDAGGGDDELRIWLAGDVLVVSPSAVALAKVGETIASGDNPFVGSEFHDRLARVYAEGTDWLLGADVGSALAREAASSTDPEHEARVLDHLGFSEIEHLVIDRIDGAGDDTAGQNRALLSFREERHGVASWLAAPAPLGALDFVSPAAHVAVAGLLKEPVEMLDDVLALAQAGEDPESRGTLARLAELEGELGISFRADVAGSLGGDFAFAFDGPWLPKPSWKIVLEVADAARLHATVQALVEAWNREVSGTDGETSAPRPTLRLAQDSVDGRVVFTLSAVTAGSAPTELAHGLFADGYLLLGPSRALLFEAVAQREAGVKLASSQAYLDLVPRDGRAHASAIVYQNIAGSVGALAELFRRAVPSGEVSSSPNGAPETETLTQMVGEAGPGLAVAYADGREVSFVARGLRGPLGMSFEHLLALGGMFRDENLERERSEGRDDSDEAAVTVDRERVETRTRSVA